MGKAEVGDVLWSLPVIHFDFPWVLFPSPPPAQTCHHDKGDTEVIPLN